MKISKPLRFISTFLLTSILSTAAFSADSFFQVGKNYLFMGRFDLVMKGKVTQVTDQEIVFTDRYILKASKPTTARMNDSTAVAIKSNAIADYLKSNNKASLLEAS